jgi:chaperonin GroEL (HSP60 family)
MDGKVVAGAGAIEAEVAKHVYEFSRTLPGKIQLAVEAFAKTVETLPQIIAHNAGYDPIETLVKLRGAHEKPEGKWYGINIENGEVFDAFKAGILEPARVKINALKAGTEAASLILRIDDLIAAKRTEEKEGKGKEEKKEEE